MLQNCRNCRGQATILIAIIFQILFMFFAMVINVGLLVHDKINLQNSTDIAAYYGAMKQAEILNAMAHTNYEIRQAWKLLAWRIWVLGDSRNPHPPPFTGSSSLSADSYAHPPSGSTDAPYPIICAQNEFWQDERAKATNGGRPQNLCNPTLNVPKLLPLDLTGFQLLPIFSSILGIFAAQSQANASAYNGDFGNQGPLNYSLATKILGSYKVAVFHRRNAMRALQALLTSSTSDFTDLSGSPVSAVVQNTLIKNLTAANKQGLQNVTFTNSLGGKPFLVPIEVYATFKYYDNNNTGSATTAAVRELNDATAPWITANENLFNEGKVFYYVDYTSQSPITAANFATEDPNTANPMRSLVGFEKNPWTLAYVSVQATTQTKMLFSPITGGTVTLTAESYAMPFGGKMGPWYGTGWAQGADLSSGDPVDPLLPTRTGGAPALTAPNYSRYPGDLYGMNSTVSQYVGWTALSNAGYPSWTKYYSWLNLNPLDPKNDPLVNNPTTITDTAAATFRAIEMAAVAPDLFDAAYYSPNYDIGVHFAGANNNWFSGASACGGVNASCWDLGTDTINTANTVGISNQLAYIKGASVQLQTPEIPVYGPAYWNLNSIFHVNTSWSQGDPGQYGADQAAKSVGQDWANAGSDGTPQGGRAGYSVKIVSKKFLTSSLPLGGTAGPGNISNPPQ